MTIVTTTLAAAVSEDTNAVSVASATGITGPGPAKTTRTVIVVDREMMEVLSVSGTLITVNRGHGGTLRKAHGSAALVWIGQEHDFEHFRSMFADEPGVLGPKFYTTAPVTLTTAGALTYTAQQVLNGQINRDPAGAARTDTLPTATLLVAALRAMMIEPWIGLTFRFSVQNDADAAETITIAVGTGGTGAGTLTIAQSNAKEFEIRITGVDSPAYTLRSKGTVTF